MSNNDIKDYYYILGLDKNASKDEIKTAYRKLSLKFHPDQNSGDKFFEERFKDLHEAYETLIDDLKRKIYDENLSRAGVANPNEKNYSGTYTARNPGARPSYQSKKSTREILFAIIMTIIFISPFILGAVKRILEKKNKSETYNLLRYDTTHNKVLDATGTAITINKDTPIVQPPISSEKGDPGTSGTTSSNDNSEVLSFKDDDGITAMDAVHYFLNALNNSDCNTAWDMMYNINWVNAGKDWFCSNKAFGTVNKVSIRNIYIVSQYESSADIYAEYYAEDTYNGNKCFKQNIAVQKVQYGDNRSRWKVTKMKNIEPPAECYGN